MTHDDSPLREDEVPAAAELLAWAFGSSPADIPNWLDRLGHDNVNVGRRAGRLEATAATLPMGQYFGGARVPMVGIAGVGTSPEARGTGAALALMKRVLHEQRAKGFALSTLYPATLGLYRKVGYERAGGHYIAKMPLPLVGKHDRSLPLRPMTPEDEPAVEACYRAKAAGVNGFADRNPYLWNRARQPRDVITRGFVVGDGTHVEGYALLHEKRDPSMRFVLHASDFVGTSARAYARLLAFAADHGTVGTHLVWSAAPNDPSAQLLPRNGNEVYLREAWMLRVLDVPAALTARGWPEHVTIDVDLDVTDDVIEGNAGRFTLHVEGGRAQVARGGKGAVRIDVRALAPLYSGWQNPGMLVTMGSLEGPSRDLAALAAAFAGTSPWMPDFF